MDQKSLSEEEEIKTPFAIIKSAISQLHQVKQKEKIQNEPEWHQQFIAYKVELQIPYVGWNSAETVRI